MPVNVARAGGNRHGLVSTSTRSFIESNEQCTLSALMRRNNLQYVLNLRQTPV